jgi:hypothetical protein
MRAVYPSRPLALTSQPESSNFVAIFRLSTLLSLRVQSIRHVTPSSVRRAAALLSTSSRSCTTSAEDRSEARCSALSPVRSPNPGGHFFRSRSETISLVASEERQEHASISTVRRPPCEVAIKLAPFRRAAFTSTTVAVLHASNSSLSTACWAAASSSLSDSPFSRSRLIDIS